jgi:type II secretory pathway component GspD/PulD (secretin)
LAWTAGQATPRSARAYSDLSSGIDGYRRGDYAGAAAFFQKAQAGQEYLSADRRQELTKYTALNNAALQARRKGAEQLRGAEAALKAGKGAEAEALLKAVTVNQFVAAADRQKAQKLLERVRPNSSGPAPAAGLAGKGVPAITLARTKLQQSRALLAKGDFTAAEALAKEAQLLKALYNMGEDTPSKVLNDIHHARTDPAWLTAAARAALKRGEIDRDEELAHAAKRAAGLGHKLKFWGDTPDKVIRDAEEARRMANKLPPARTPGAIKVQEMPSKAGPLNAGPLNASPGNRLNRTGAPTGPANAQGDGNQSRTPTAAAKSGIQQVAAFTVSAGAATTAAATPAQQARQLLKKARQALQAGNATQAKQYVAQASALKVEYNWWEDTPDKVSADIQRAVPRLSEARTAQGSAVSGQRSAVSGQRPAVGRTPLPAVAQAKTGAAAKTTAAKPPARPAKPDAAELVRTARARLNAKKLDEAEKLACQAKTARPNGWGLFDDSPDKVLQDVRKARAKHNREESVQLLVEARKLYEQGKYADARTKAYRAERLHGTYSIWDLGDRPQKLLAEIDTTEAKSHRVKVPPAPAAPERPAPIVVASRTKPAPKPVTPYAPAPVQVASAATTTPKIQPASAVATPPRVQPASAPTPPAPSWPKETTAVAANTSVNVSAPPSPAPAPARYTPPVPRVDLAKQQALSLMAEARQLQGQGRLLEARQKALDAQRLGASFGSNEDRPERLLIALAGQANNRIYGLMQSATDVAATAGDDVHRYRRAEEALGQARQLAAGFALDTQPVDAKLAWVRQTRDRALAAASAVAARGAHATPPGVMPVQYQQEAAANPMQRQGLELLDKARLELRNGNTVNARRFAEEAYKDAYGVRPQAESVLRSVDTEEFNQRRLVANRTYEAGYAAFQRREFVQAAAVLRSVDMSLLDSDKAARYREVMRTPELQTLMPASAQVPGGAGGGTPGHAVASDQPAATPEQTFAQRVSAMQEVQFQKLRNDGLQAQRNAIERYRAGDADRAIDILREYLDGLPNAHLDAGKVALLRKPVESRLEQFRALKTRNDLEKLQAGQHETFASLQAKHQQAEQFKQEKVADLMKQYKALYKEGKYDEAEVVAMKAHELDPDNVAADAAVHVAQIHHNLATYRELKSEKEKMVLNGLNDTDDEGPYVGMKEPLKFDKQTWDRVKGRGKEFSTGLEIRGLHSEKDREIERSLTQPVSFDFKDRPLREVITELRAMTSLNIIPDVAALEEENVSLDKPLTLNLEGVSLRSALNLLLRQAHLTYVIKDEALQVTTPTHARGKLVQKTYSVADLVISVDDFSPSPGSKLDTIFDQQVQRVGGGFYNNVSPYVGMNTLPNGVPVGAPASALPGAQSMTSTSPANGLPFTSAPQSARTQGQTMENVLIATIKNTVAPGSWSDMGGPGTIDYFPLGMALVINQTPDIQEQVAELLAALRRLQDIEVAVEVRFITISEQFYERIGVDFNLNIVNRDTAKYEPQITSGQFAPNGFVNRFIPSSFISGITPAGIGSGPGPGAFTHDLNIPIQATSFGPATPPFGGFALAPGADGGLSLGLAFLSDIQVFMFMEAAQGDRRTNVMQAPKLTMYNGQTATINVLDFQYFVTGNIIGLINGQVTVAPQNTPFPIGTTLTMQPVVSADRRFVRISMAPTLANLTTPLAALFPITTIVQTTYDVNLPGPPVPIVQYIQQPQINRITVNTTVNVPDGGTVLMGGLKILREGRNEFGPPILSKIPYLNRLWKNTGYGRDADSLMIMVTPRIIINEEEETRQTGYIVPPAGGGL